MCGFVVIFNKTGLARKRDLDLKRAGERLVHRGPDDAGFYQDDHVGMAFRRLKIIDLSDKARQPFVSQDGRYVLAYNGEIYNYRELKSDLEKRGIKFRSDSDTEVLLACYREFGEGAFAKLRGMFAIALWDTREKTLLLARDRFGIKPLYVYRHGDEIIAASEIKAILALAPEEAQVDERSVFKYLVRNFADDTNDTFYSAIKAFPRSSFLAISLAKESLKTYWELGAGANLKFNKEDFYGIFEETVKLHLRSDVPVSSTLSGGMDSTSLVAAAVASGGAKDLRTFSVLPPNTFDESPWINEMVAYAGVPHEYVATSNLNLSKVIDEILGAHDEPFQYVSCAYQYLLRRELKKRGLKVLLVGEGADEVLAGYRRMIFGYLRALRQRIGSQELEVLAFKAASLFSHADAGRVLKDFADYEKILSQGTSGQENQSAFVLFSPEWMRAHSDVVDEPMYPKDLGECGFFELLKKHLFVRNLPFVLRMEDRNAMACGIEARVPYLDHVFVEYVFSHDVAEFMRDGENKSMLRRAMQGRLPQGILDRKAKTNRPGSHSHAMYKVLKTEFCDILNSRDFEMDWFATPNLKNEFEADAAKDLGDRAEFWFRIYVYHKWQKRMASAYAAQ